VRIRHHPRTPVLEVLDAVDADPGLVDVDPVVGEKLWVVDGKRDRDKVAIPQAASRLRDLARGWRIESADKLA
jgi:hypothetical protein